MHNNTENNDNFKSFKYKTKLLGNRVADGANGILRNAAIAVPLKYLSSFWRSLEMQLINCWVELKVEWRKYCVLSVAGNENNINEDANVIDIIFTIKDTNFVSLIVNICSCSNFIRKRRSKTIKTL